MNINRRKKNILTNYKVKLFSLLSAILLWFFVVTNDIYEHVIYVDLNLVNQPEGMVLVEPVPDKVRVKFRGRGQSFIKLYFRSKRIDVDLHHIKKTALIPLTIDMIKNIPHEQDFEALNIVKPDSLKIHLDRFIEKKVIVNSNLIFVPKPGFVQVDHVLFQPDSILVCGPRSLVNRIDAISTVETEYTNLFKTIDGKVELIQEYMETVSYSTNSVKFEADIQRIHEIVVSDIPIEVIHVPRGIKVSVIPTTLSIRLQGGVEVLKKLDENEIKATINYSRSRNKGTRIPATIQVPRNISFSDVKPQKFELLVER